MLFKDIQYGFCIEFIWLRTRDSEWLLLPWQTAVCGIWLVQT
jgi:hypothetical protein